MIHELGTCFYAKSEKEGIIDVVAVYFTGNKEVYFHGKLSQEELEKLGGEGIEVKSIYIDEVRDEIVIEE